MRSRKDMALIDRAVGIEAVKGRARERKVKIGCAPNPAEPLGVGMDAAKGEGGSRGLRREDLGGWVCQARRETTERSHSGSD